MYSHTIDRTALQQLLDGARVIERDAHGVKVAILPDGNFLKLFRVKNTLSLAWLRPYSLRFCRNAARLQRLGYATVTVREHLRIRGSRLSGVIYAPLAGATLRELIHSGAVDEALCRRIGAFIARLHGDGVYFRSLHSGNIVLTPGGEPGLIDIADMRFHRRALSDGLRRRNWRHLFRYAQDFSGNAFVLTEMFAAYGAAASLPAGAVAALEAQYRARVERS